MFPKFRRSAVIVLTSALAVSTILSASATSTTKNLSSNFTLVNLVDGTNQGTIEYIDENGANWRPEENPEQPSTFTMQALGDQVERRQYFDEKLPGGSGSVVVSTQGPVGAVVQIQAREQSGTNGAYIGVSEGSPEANLPLVARRRGTLSGIANSQIIIQNASPSNTPINVEVKFYDGSTGAELGFIKTISNLAPKTSFEYDLEEETNLPENFIGSAVVRSTTPGGEVAVVSNFFLGTHAMQTYNAFTEFKTAWGVPLLTVRLANGLSTPFVIQNKSDEVIQPGDITLSCQVSDTSPNQEPTITRSNTQAIAVNASSFEFNPALLVSQGGVAPEWPADWRGSCRLDTGGHETAVFLQMRWIGKEAEGNERAGAYEAVPLDGTSKTVMVPLYLRRLSNGFASNVTILNLSETQPANVTLAYKALEPDYDPAKCSETFTRQIPPGGALFQNHRVENGVDDSVPEVEENCQGTLRVTSSDQPIDAFVQIDQLEIGLGIPVPPRVSGDRFMAHNVFLLP
jgi:hypothetical protein